MSHQSTPTQPVQPSTQSESGSPPQSAGAGQTGGGAPQPIDTGAVQQPAAPASRGQHLFATHNFLDEQLRTTSVQVLNQVLADVVVLRSHVETAHWNVRGPDFYQLHDLFDDVAEMLEAHVDEIAERAAALGGVAAGDVHQAVQRTTLQPFPPDLIEGQGLLDAVAADVARVDRTLYWEMQRAEDLGDLDTLDLLNEVSRDVAKALWFVEAHLQGPGAAATPATGPFTPRAAQGGQGQPSTQGTPAPEGQSPIRGRGS